MKRPTLTAGQRIASRFANGWYGWPAEREEKLAAAIDRAVKAARRDVRLQLTGSANNPCRKARKDARLDLRWTGAAENPYRREGKR